MKKIWLFGLIGILFLSALAWGEMKTPIDTLVDVTFGKAKTCDPAFSYDTASGVIIFHVYNNLLGWPEGLVEGTEYVPTHSLDASKLVPQLATVVPTIDNGLVYTRADGNLSYQFPIRRNVPFHEGGTLTPEDVEYTFERGMLQDRDGGPQWMLLEPLTGYGRLYQAVEDVLGIDTNKGETIADLTPEQQKQVYDEVIAPAVEVTPGGDVVFNLAQMYPPFLTILTHGGSWGAILDKEWVIDQGGWDGSADGWAAWYNPGGGQRAEASELYEIANGCGPFSLESWDPGVEIVFERFDDYWQGPAKLKTVVYKKVEEWSDRLLMLQQGDADIILVDPMYVPQVLGLEGVDVALHLPALSLNPVAFFTSDLVMEGNDLVGSGEWGENGIPAVFFNDANLRKAFAYAFEYDTYVDEVLGINGGFTTHGPIPKAFDWAYDDRPELYYTYDMEKAIDYMKLAHDGKVWNEGFTFTLLYNTGNNTRRVICEILEQNIESMNPKFHVEIRDVPWSTYLGMAISGQMPLWVIGWLADYPDPHNFAVPFAYSTGTFSGWQGPSLIAMFAEKYDPLIDAAMDTVDLTERAALYYQIEQMSFDDCYDIWLPQSDPRVVKQSYVQGYSYNPIYPHHSGTNWYTIYKEEG